MTPRLRHRFSARHRTIRYAVAVASAAFLVWFVYFLTEGPAAEGEHWSSDYMIEHISPAPPRQNKQIALVYVTDRTLKPFPYTSPIDRGLLARLVRIVDAAGASAIGLDIIFDRETEPSKDSDLIDAINGAHQPVVVGVLDARTPPTAYDAQEQTNFTRKLARAAFGHIYFDDSNSPLINTDHVVRAIAEPSRAAADGGAPPASFVQALARAGGSDKVMKTPLIDWLPKPADGTQTFLELTADDLLGPLADSVKPLLEHRYVIIGANISDRDQHQTPLSVGGLPSPGAWIHAQALAQILSERGLYAAGRYGTLIAVLVCAAIGFAIGRHAIAEHYHLVTELCFAAVLVGVGIATFRCLHFLFPFGYAFLGGMIGVAIGHIFRIRARAVRPA